MTKQDYINNVLSAITTNTDEKITGDLLHDVLESGLSIDHVVETTYSALKALRDASGLTPGMFYRITDYACTTTQTDTQSAGHQFDVVVVATDESTLNENAFAMKHDGDTYFAAHAYPVTAYAAYLTYAERDLSSWELKYCLDNDKERFAWADEENGKGVIFYMKDEFNNECPYDFKNIQFKRYKITSVNGSTEHSLVGTYGLANNKVVVNTDDYVWQYTFNGMEDSDQGITEYYDFSTLNPTLTSAVREQFGVTHMGLLNFCDGNVIKEVINYGESDYEGAATYMLNNIVFQCKSHQQIEESIPFVKIGSCYDNKFETFCINITFGYDIFGNSFKNYCQDNTFGNGCSSNSFGNYCSYNTFGNYFRWNTFGNGCYSNTFGNSCYRSSFGNDCCYNSFGNGCDDNSFGNGCSSNSFGNDCCYNSFGNGCDDNSFGNDCCSNTFGNYFQNNTFGNYCYYNSFGNKCYWNTFGNYMRWCTFEDGVQYVTASRSVGDTAYLQNMHVLNGTQGERGSLLTITITTSRTYCTFVGKNSSGTLKVWVPADSVA